MDEIHRAANLYFLSHRHYPANLNELREEYFPSGVPKNRFTTKPYVYVTDGQNFALICYGHDDKPGGSKPGDHDIVFTERGCLTSND